MTNRDLKFIGYYGSWVCILASIAIMILARDSWSAVNFIIGALVLRVIFEFNKVA